MDKRTLWQGVFCSQGLGCQAAEVDLAVGTLVETGEHSATEDAMPATVCEYSSQELRVYHANANCVTRGNIDDDLEEDEVPA